MGYAHSMWIRVLLVLMLLVAAPARAAVSAGSVEDLRKQFNADRDNVRVVALLSPTCGMCRIGHRVVQVAFKKVDSHKLKGYVVWLPLLRSDSGASCNAEEEVAHPDDRISLWWNE